MINSLQSQIEELKNQLNSQNNLISKLCYQQLEQQLHQKLMRNSNQNMKSNTKNSHQRYNSSMRRRGSGDYDQVIIEEEQEEEQQTFGNYNNNNKNIVADDESKFNGEISIVAAANNQGDSGNYNSNDQSSCTNNVEDFSILRKLSLEINRNYDKFAGLRKSLNIFNNKNNTNNISQISQINNNESNYNSNITNITNTPNNNHQQVIENIIRQSLSKNPNNILSINNQNNNSLAIELEKQFKQIVENKAIKSQQDKQIIEDVLQSQKHKQLTLQNKNFQQSPTINNLVNEKFQVNSNKNLPILMQSHQNLNLHDILNGNNILLDSDRQNNSIQQMPRCVSQTGEITLRYNLNNNKMETKQSFEENEDYNEYESINYKNQHYINNNISTNSMDEDSFDVGEESVANETEFNHSKSRKEQKHLNIQQKSQIHITASIVPKGQEKQKLIDNLNSTQNIRVINKDNNCNITSNYKQNNINLPPKNVKKIMKNYNTDAIQSQNINDEDSQRTHRYQQFNKTQLKNQNNITNNNTSFYSANTILGHNQKTSIKVRTKCNKQQNLSQSSQNHNQQIHSSTPIQNLKQQNNISHIVNNSMQIKGNQTQTISQSKIMSIDLLGNSKNNLSRLNTSKSKQNSISLTNQGQSSQKQQSQGFQSIVQSAATSLKNLTLKNLEKRNNNSSKCSTQNLSNLNQSDLKNITNYYNNPTTDIRTRQISTVLEDDQESQYNMLDPEPASRSPSIKDERGSTMPLEKPKGFVMQEKNHHPLYFKIQSNDPSKRNSLIRLSNGFQNDKVKQINNNASQQRVCGKDDNRFNQNNESRNNQNQNSISLPRQSLTKNNKMQLRQSCQNLELNNMNTSSQQSNQQHKLQNHNMKPLPTHIYLKQKRPSTSISTLHQVSLDNNSVSSQSNLHNQQFHHQTIDIQPATKFQQQHHNNKDKNSQQLQDRAMIAKFYNNQPLRQNYDSIDSVDNNIQLDNQNQRYINESHINDRINNHNRLTDLKEARIKNRSESRQKQFSNTRDLSANLQIVQQQQQSLQQQQFTSQGSCKQFGSITNQLNSSQQNYNSLNRSGNYSSKIQNINQNNQSSLDETLQVVKDILQVKRNQSSSNLSQINIQSQNCSSGLNASMLFDRQNINSNGLNDSINMTHNSNGLTQKKPPIRQIKSNANQTPIGMNQDLKSSLISLGKENLDEFFVMYENFKQSNQQTSQKHQSHLNNINQATGSNSFINNQNSINQPSFIHSHKNSNSFSSSLISNTLQSSSYQNGKQVIHKGVLSPDQTSHRLQHFNPSLQNNINTNHNQSSRLFLNPQNSQTIFHVNQQNQAQYQMSLVGQEQQQQQQQQQQLLVNPNFRGRSTSEYSNIGIMNGLSRPFINKNNHNIYQREL